MGMSLGINRGITLNSAAAPFDRARNLFKNAPELYYSASSLPGQVVFEKRRSDFNEFRVFTPITPDGIEWQFFFFTDRLQTLNALDGAFIHRAFLWSSTTANNFGETVTPKTPTTDYATTDATGRTGTWTSAATINGVDDVRWTATTGESVTYRVTVPAGGRIYLRSVENSSNGGVGNVVITQVNTATEIASDEYLARDVGGVRKFFLNSSGATPGICLVPLAEVVDGTDYDVVLTRDSASAVGGRLYESAPLVYDPIAFNDTGVHGSVSLNASGGTNADFTVQPGTRIVYLVQNATRASIRHYGLSSGGQASVTVYNSAGAEISTYVTETVESYSASSTNVLTNIFADQTKGDYYIHLQLLPTKNASSSDYRLYAQGNIAYDQETAGTPGVDAFDLGDFPLSPSNALALGTAQFGGPPNFAHASSWRSTGSMAGDEDFVTGVHLNETDLRIGTIGVGGYTFKMDGTTLDYAALAIGAYTVGSELQVTFSTTVNTPDNAAAFATFARDWRFNRRGWTHGGTFTLTADAYLHINYILMLQTPNGGDTRSDSVGALNTVWLDQSGVSYLQDQSDNSNDIEDASIGFVHAGAEYAVYGLLEATSSVNASSLLRDLSSHQAKSYALAAVTDAVNGDLIPSGAVFTTRKSWRVLKGTFA